jgi:hypothetical protein
MSFDLACIILNTTPDPWGSYDAASSRAALCVLARQLEQGLLAARFTTSVKTPTAVVLVVTEKVTM